MSLERIRIGFGLVCEKPNQSVWSKSDFQRTGADEKVFRAKRE